MSKQELIRKLNKKFMKKSIPVIKAGHTVKVVSKFKEWDKERTQSFEWLVIKVNWKSWDINSTITVRKISEWVWVERIFPIHSTNVVSIEIIKIAKVRRAKLYYMRDRFGKSARLKEIRTTQTNRDEMVKTFWEEKVQVPDTNSEEVKEWKKEVANNNKEKVKDMGYCLQRGRVYGKS